MPLRNEQHVVSHGQSPRGSRRCPKLEIDDVREMFLPPYLVLCESARRRWGEGAPGFPPAPKPGASSESEGDSKEPEGG